MTKQLPDIAKLNEQGKPQCCSCLVVLRKAKRSDFWRFSENVQAYGWAGNSLFCSQRCAAEFGIIKASTMVDS